MHTLQSRFSARRSFAPLLSLAVLLTLGACKDDKPDDPQPTSNSLELHLEHVGADAAAFALGKSYTNAAGNAYKVTRLKYYLSNVKLTKTDGTVWSEPKSYHLVDIEAGVTPDFELTAVPVGDYNKITFSIGVDSATNHSLDHPGDLDPAVAGSMYWAWESTYKFIMFEGTQVLPPTTPPTPAPSFLIHTGEDRNYRTLTLTLPENATVRGNIAPEIHFSADVNSLFGATGSPNLITLRGTDYSTMAADAADVPKVMNNALTMFSIEHVHNDLQ